MVSVGEETSLAAASGVGPVPSEPQPAIAAEKIAKRMQPPVLTGIAKVMTASRLSVKELYQ
jgi:hypothetical protein